MDENGRGECRYTGYVSQEIAVLKTKKTARTCPDGFIGWFPTPKRSFGDFVGGGSLAINVVQQK
jgi:hypothetical protein